MIDNDIVKVSHSLKLGHFNFVFNTKLITPLELGCYLTTIANSTQENDNYLEANLFFERFYHEILPIDEERIAKWF